MKNLIILTFILFFLKPLQGNSQNYPDYAQVLSRYIQFPSIEYQEKGAGLYLLDQCKKAGLFTEVLISKDTAFNFAASIYPLSSRKPNIIFLNHIDVVPAGDSSKWSFPPYEGVMQDSIIYGRGAIDNKAMAVAQLFAIKKFSEEISTTTPPFNVTLLSVSGEETGGFRGARIIADTYLEHLSPCLILGEGGSGVNGIIRSQPERPVFGISVVDKTKLVLELEMTISSTGHGAVPSEEYAAKEIIVSLNELLKTKSEIIYHPLAVEALKELGDYEKGINGFVQRHFTFLFFRPLAKRVIRNNPELRSFFSNTVALTQINTHEGEDNQIVQSIHANLDCRLMPGYSINRFVRKVEKQLGDDRIQVRRKFVSKMTGPSESPEYFHGISEAIRKTYPDAVVLKTIFPATTDNIYFREKGVPVLGVFPAMFTMTELKSIHNDNENIHLSRIADAIEIYSHFLHSFYADSSMTSR